MNRNRKAFLIALALYLPFLATLWQVQNSALFAPPPSDREAAPLPFRYFHPDDPIAVIEPELESIHPPEPLQSPPDVATASEPTPPQERAEESAPTQEPKKRVPPLPDLFAPAPLSSQELSEAFQEPEKSPAAPPKRPQIPDSEIGDLYGDMIYDLSPQERAFIEDRLEGIGRITQRYLRYPELAGRLRMSGEVVLAFTLLPNGDITPIEVLRSSGYSLLDDNAIHTVEIAHKDYPHPDEPVRIRLRVIYRLY